MDFIFSLLVGKDIDSGLRSFSVSVPWGWELGFSRHKLDASHASEPWARFWLTSLFGPLRSRIVPVLRPLQPKRTALKNKSLTWKGNQTPPFPWFLPREWNTGQKWKTRGLRAFWSGHSVKWKVTSGPGSIWRQGGLTLGWGHEGRKGRNTSPGPQVSGVRGTPHHNGLFYSIHGPLTLWLSRVCIMFEQKQVKNSLLMSSTRFSKPSLMSGLESVFHFSRSLACLTCLPWTLLTSSPKLTWGSHMPSEPHMPSSPNMELLKSAPNTHTLSCLFPSCTPHPISLHPTSDPTGTRTCGHTRYHYCIVVTPSLLSQEK